MNFILSAATLENIISHRIAKKITHLGVAIFVITTPAYIWYGTDRLFAVLLFCFAIGGFFFMWRRFIDYYRSSRSATLPDPSLNSDKLLNCLSLEAAQIVARAKKDFHPHSLLKALFASRARAFLFKRLETDRQKIAEIFKTQLTLPDEPKTLVMTTAAALAQKNRHEKIELSDLILSAASLSTPFKKFLLEKDLQLNDMECIALWYMNALRHEQKTALTNLENSYGIGRSWAYAFTPLLNRFSRAVNYRLRAGGDALHLLVHKNEVELLEEALAKSSAANALIIGEAGIGKMTIVQGFAELIARGQSFSNLNYKQVVQLNLELLFGEKNPGDTIGLISRVLKEAERAGNIILVIDNIENYLSPHSKTNISEILVPFLKSTYLKIIGITDRAGFGRGTVNNPELYTLFEKVEIAEPNREQIMKILTDMAIHKEKQRLPFVTYRALEKVYELSARYITELPFPEKATGLFEDVVIYALAVGEKKSIRSEHVEAVLERKLKLPIGDLEHGESKKLLNLEIELHKRVIDQTEAIGAIADAMRRSRTGLSATGKPVGSFLFLGPTGVGKTETAKALAEIYFGNQEKMLRFDMSEYQKISDMPRLTGSQELSEPGLMANAVRENPLSLVLLDEIEKAHPNILNLFLQILDEGYCTDAFGKKVDFRNAIIIATSNAGAEFIRESIAKNTAYEDLQTQLIDKVLKDGIFKPEFLNRFDRVAVFKPLSLEDTAKVAELLLKSLGKRLTEQGYDFKISQETAKKLAETVSGSVFGARELKRLIQDSIESKLAKELLEGKYQKGGTIIL